MQDATQWFANVTTDETWAYLYDPLTKRQSRKWLPKGSCPLEKQKSQGSAIKVMLITFFDRDGLIYVHEMPEKVNVNRTIYKAALVKLLNVHIWWKGPQY